MKIKPIFQTTLAEDVPEGPQGQPAHKKGSAMAIASMLDTKKLGKFAIVTPNPVFFYLNLAEQLIEEFKKEIAEIDGSKKEWHMYKSEDNVPSDKFRHLSSDLSYSCMQKAIGATIMLFSAIEAFANQAIPENYIYRRKNNKGVILEFNKEAIETQISTEEKIGVILSDINGKKAKQETFWNDFMKLKKLRNDLIHLKTRGVHVVMAYNGIYTELIDSDFDAFFKATKGIMKFFIDSYFN